MDLLGGYGSDSSAADSVASSSSSGEADKKVVPQTKPSATIQKTPAAAATNTTAPKRKTKINKRGRKLVSLNAVLPPAIFERLARHNDADDDDDSDEEDITTATTNGKNEVNSKKKNAKQTQKRRPKGGEEGKDDDLNAMLRELRSAPVVSTTAALSSSSKTKSNKEGKKEELGFAFTNVTTTTVTKKSDDDAVVDIHAAPTKKESTQSKEKVEQNDDPIPSVQRPHISTTVPRPGLCSMSTTIRRPPTINAAPGMSTTPSNPISSTTNATVHNAPPSYENDNNDYNDHTNNNTKKRKRSTKQELSRALRSGNFSSLSSSTTSISQPLSTYTPTEAHLSATASRSAELNVTRSTGKLKMYDPKAGMDVDVKEVTNKHKSKHQINQLMVNAASLEVKRRGVGEWSAGGVGGTGGGTVKGSSSRMNAKKKYGW